MNKPALHRCCCRWRLTPIVWRLAASGAGAGAGGLPIRLNLQVEDETRTQERLRRGEVVGAVSIQHQALPSCPVDKLGALDYLFVASKPFAERYFPMALPGRRC